MKTLTAKSLKSYMFMFNACSGYSLYNEWFQQKKYMKRYGHFWHTFNVATLTL